jgi:sensor histidine kinase regulating citrate/malate metabolism
LRTGIPERFRGTAVAVTPASVPALRQPGKVARRDRRLGFAARLGLAMSALIVVVCGVQSWLVGHRDLEELRGYLTTRGKTIAEELAQEAAPAVAAGNVQALRQLAGQARARSDIVYCRFFDSGGLLLVSFGKSVSGARGVPHEGADPRQPIEVDADLWEFRAPVYAAGEIRRRLELGPSKSGTVVGTVAIGVSLTPLQALRRTTLATATLATSLFMLIAVLCAVGVARAITRSSAWWRARSTRWRRTSPRVAPRCRSTATPSRIRWASSSAPTGSSRSSSPPSRTSCARRST